MSAVQPSTSIGEILAEFGGEVKTGPFGTALKASEYTNFGVPVISVGEIGHGVIQIHDRTPLVDDAVLSRLPEYVLREGDIVFARKGSVERTALIGKREAGWFLGSDGIRLRLPNTVSSRFVRYWISSPTVREWLTQNSTGSTMASLNQATIKRLPISLPSLSMQKAIASTLGALDDKIELNRRMSAVLEEMARALYRSWFIDFDPVHARALGQPPAHMDPTTAALFPDSFAPDGLPKGWEMRSIYDFARVQYGAAFKSSLFNTKSDGRPLVRIRDLKNHTAGVHTTETHKKEHLIQPGDTVVGMDGDFTAYSWCNEPALMNQRVCSFLPKVADNRSFVRHGIVPLLKAEEEAAVATTVIHLGKKDIDKFILPDPGAGILEAFSSIAEPLTDRFIRLGLENITLAALRDTLLPRLMSGEVRIREAEKKVEEVV